MKVMKKIKERGAEYVKTESERLGRMLSEFQILPFSLFSILCLSSDNSPLSLAHSLSLHYSLSLSLSPWSIHSVFLSLITGGAISAKKSDEFTKKRNVLRKFEL